MTRMQVLFLVVVGAGAALLGVLTAPLLGPSAPPPPPPAEVEPAGPQITRTTPIPKPERAPRGAEPAAAAAPTDATGAVQGGPAPEARSDDANANADDTGVSYGQVDPSRPFTPDEIQATVATFQEDIAACLDEWGPQIEGFDGRVVLQADFSPEGLQDVRIADLDNVPLQLLGCFSTPVWEATWPQPDGAVTISYPFLVEVPGAPDE